MEEFKKMEKALKTFIESLRTETLGFSFGEPWRYEENTITCVLPIVRTSKKKRKYILLGESDKIEIIDTGNINIATVQNDSNKHVYIRLGSMLKGATQERSPISSYIIPPETARDLEVKCVHASRPILAGSPMKFDQSIMPRRDSMYLQSSYTTGGRGSSAGLQGQSWTADRDYTDDVQVYCASVGRADLSNSIPDDDIVKAHETFQKVDAEKIIRDMPLIDNQIGMAIIDTRGFYNLECYDLHESWKVVKEAIAGKEALKLAQKDKSGVFEYKPEKAKGTIKDILKKGYEEKIIREDGDTKIIGFSMDGYIGEAALIGKEVIHLVITRNE